MMKRSIIVAILSIWLLVCSNFQLFSQATSGNNGNSPIGTQDYIGWTNGTNAPLTIKNEDNQDIHFYTNAGAGTLNNRKMTIERRIINSIERAGVSIHDRGTNAITFPRSLLHVGNNYFTSGIGGWRTWMNVGMFTGLQSDLAFFGIMPDDGDSTDSQADHNDAVIAWGDNENPAADGADNLRIIFTAPMTNGASRATRYLGQEVGRFTPLGQMGIGNFSANGSTIQPWRRLEIYDEHLDPDVTVAAPQLRLTYTPNASVALGNWTDFQTISTGDLYIHPSAGGNNRRVGVNAPLPQYGFHNQGTSLFTTTSITAPLVLYSGSGSPLMVNSDNYEGLSILHQTSGNGRDMLKLYADDDDYGYGNIPLYHFRTMGSGQWGDVTFDHGRIEAGDYSWLGYNTDYHMTVMKGDFNTSRFAPTISTALGNLVSGNGAKLYVEAQTPIAQGNRMVYGIVSSVSNTNLDYYHTGVLGYVETPRTNDDPEEPLANIGGMFFATGAHSIVDRPAINIGMQAAAVGDATHSNNYGVFSLATTEGVNNAGVWCSSDGGTNTNYALYATVGNSNCQDGTCPEAAGFFDGSVYTTDDYYKTSDATLKTNIQPFEGDSLLRLISIYSYDFMTQNPYKLDLPNGNHYGVLAQDVEQVLPNLVRTFVQPVQYDSLGNVVSQEKSIKAVNYDEFIPLLIAAYQKQADKMDSITARLDSLTIIVSNCCAQPRIGNNVNTAKNNLTIELENTNAIVLNQNDPNPFAEQTTITWNIPQETGALNAMLMFYDNTGSILKTVKINEAGAGSLLVYGSKLSTGIYTYSLVVNNKTIDSKRMVKTK